MTASMPTFASIRASVDRDAHSSGFSHEIQRDDRCCGIAGPWEDPDDRVEPDLEVRPRDPDPSSRACATTRIRSIAASSTAAGRSSRSSSSSELKSSVEPVAILSDWVRVWISPRAAVASGSQIGQSPSPSESVRASLGRHNRLERSIPHTNHVCRGRLSKPLFERPRPLASATKRPVTRVGEARSPRRELYCGVRARV